VTINYSKQAVKFLRKQTLETKEQIIQKIEKLAAREPNLDIKTLTDMGADFRLRYGKIRILFDDYGNVIDIIKIGYRGNVYKKGGR